MYLGGVTVGCRAYNREVVGLNCRRVAIKRLLLKQATVGRQVSNPG